MACSDDPVTSLADLNTENMADMYRDLAVDDANLYILNCPVLNLAHMPDSTDELVTSDIPALLLQGGLDPATPVSGGNTVQSGLANSYNVIFPTGTHIQGGSSCGLTIMDAFMTDPSTAPDTSCTDQPLAFAVPRLVTVISDDGTTSISMRLPAGFQEISGGYSKPPVVISLLALPPQTPETAIESVVSQIGLPDNEIVDGAPVAGYPTKRYQAENVSLQGFQFGFDIIALADEAGAYVIVVQNQDPNNVAQYRQENLPALLESVFVGGK
jgi:hypothetical protein